jgi:small subunit ribosomal protein S1
VNLHLLRNAYEDKIPVKGKVTGLTKGGYVINLSGIRAFCPVSQINDRPVTDMNRFMGESFDFRIIKFNDKGRNIVVSRRKIQEEKRAILKKEALENLEVGMVVKGKVTRLTNFGAFIDLGGIDGLLHISQFSWGRVESPNEMLNLGDEVETKIINIKGDKISLSLKALQENPFDIAIKELKEGDVVNCRILRNQPFGSFAEIKPGVEGLIPISELARGRRIASPDEIVSEGDLVEVQILNIDKDKRKISLSMKALQPDPWDSINDYVQEGNVVTGKIENIMNFGVFVKIKDGVTGLIPQSKLKQAKENITEDQIGEDYKVRVAKIDVVKKRISLEPTNLPESTVDKNNWRKFKKSNVQEVEGDNPFSVL